LNNDDDFVFTYKNGNGTRFSYGDEGYTTASSVGYSNIFSKFSGSECSSSN
jgi:hypothetical protein